MALEKIRIVATRGSLGSCIAGIITYYGNTTTAKDFDACSSVVGFTDSAIDHVAYWGSGERIWWFDQLTGELELTGSSLPDVSVTMIGVMFDYYYSLNHVDIYATFDSIETLIGSAENSTPCEISVAVDLSEPSSSSTAWIPTFFVM